MSYPNLTNVAGGKTGASAKDTEAYSENFFGKSAATASKDGEAEQASEKRRKAQYGDVVKSYYDQVTDFYEYGWGQSFHFAPIRRGETYQAAQERHQHRLALKIKAGTGMKILDIGCGVGGPGREIADLSGAHVVGINIHAYQIERATIHSKNRKLDHLCSYVEGDFLKMPFEDNSFDAAFSVEATCHAPDLSKVYGEACRVVKPGGLVGVYEWIYTDKFDSDNKHHYDVIHGLLEGNGLPALRTQAEVRKAVQDAGLELLEMQDLLAITEVPWYSPLTSGKDISQSFLRSTALGRKTTQAMLYGMEVLGKAPKGITKTHAMLCRGADGLVEAGKLEIFSPMLLFVARKPLAATS